VAAKRKGSFKKWLRSSHRKFTSNSSNSRLVGKDAAGVANNGQIQNGGQQHLDSLKIKKVLSNSEDLKIKSWLIEEPNIQEEEDNNQGCVGSMSDEQQELIIQHLPPIAEAGASSSRGGFGNGVSSSSMMKNFNLTSMPGVLNSSTAASTTTTTTNEEETDDGSVPPPMNVIRPEHSEQVNSCSFYFCILKFY
jgi:hypothetical protein